MKGGTVQINWHDTQPVLTLDFHPPLEFSPPVAVITTSRRITKETSDSFLSKSLSYHSSAVNSLRFCPSGELLASGADGGELVLWKLHSTDDGQTWKVLKTLLFHRKDVLDLQWSADGAYLISGSVDNSCIIWDVNKGCVHQILDAHLHYVQGVAWDPLGQYVASLSSDRTCRVYVNKPQTKSKGLEKINFVCQQTLTKSDPQKLDDSKPTPPKTHLFHDETLPSFFRRLSWSPDGSFLLVPSGICKHLSGPEVFNTAYIISRKDLSRPAIQLPANKPIVAVRFCPVLFCLCGSKSAGLFKLPYRVIFAVATLDSLYIYDTESMPPIAIFAGLHYAAITDISWSPDAKHLALSSRDGYCTVLEFENDELGQLYSPSETKKPVVGNAHSAHLNPETVTMEIDDQDAGKLEREANSKPIEGEGTQKLSASTKNSDVKKTTKKRITPVAIN